MKRDEAISLLQQHEAELKRLGVEHLYMFGSMATDTVEAIERIHDVLENISLQAFEADWQRQWLVQRGVTSISQMR